MPQSTRSKLVSRVIRRRLKNGLMKTGEPEPLREGIPATPKLGRPSGVSDDRVKGKVTGNWHRAEGAAKDGPVVLYIHGGGYVFGSVGTHAGLSMRLAKYADANLFSVEYRLAPEASFPAAIDDVLDAWDMLIAEGIPADRIVVAGDSAGGGLTLSLLQRLKERGDSLPAGAITYSVWADLTMSGESVRIMEEREAMLRADTIGHAADAYRGDLDAGDPRISPLFGDLTGLPPILMFVSDAEILMDDTRRVAARIEEANGHVEVRVVEGAPHAWPTLVPLIPEATDTLKESGAFVKKVARRG